jgi:MFS family permease
MVSLRYRDYRLFWYGNVMAVSGQQMQWVAQGWLIYELTGSPVLLGIGGLARAIPATLFALVGGALADKWDQRRLLLSVQFLQMGVLALLASLTLTEVIEVWQVLLLISVTSGLQSFENPARQAIFPRLVPREALVDAVSLNATVHPGSRFVGPMLGGFLMAGVAEASGLPLAGAAAMFYLTAFGHLVNFRLLSWINLPPIQRSGGRESLLTDLTGGLKLVAATPIFATLIGATYLNQFFGWSFQALFPVFAKDVFGGGEVELGLLYSAVGGGSLVGTVIATNLSSARRRGVVILTGFIVGGGFLAVASASPALELALALLVLVGASQAVFNVSAQSTMHQLVPAEYRGRVMGIWSMTHTTVQPLGQLQMGVVAALASAPFAGVAGGIAIMTAGAFMSLRLAYLRRLEVEHEHAEEKPPAAVG